MKDQKTENQKPVEREMAEGERRFGVAGGWRGFGCCYSKKAHSTDQIRERNGKGREKELWGCRRGFGCGWEGTSHRLDQRTEGKRETLVQILFFFCSFFFFWSFVVSGAGKFWSVATMSTMYPYFFKKKRGYSSGTDFRCPTSTHVSVSDTGTWPKSPCPCNIGLVGLISPYLQILLLWPNKV